jgi:hypothetical protein
MSEENENSNVPTISFAENPTESHDEMQSCWTLCDCCCSCCSSFEAWWDENKTKIAGKMGIALSILNSVFLVVDSYYPASIAKYIVASLISAGVFMGGLMYDRLARDHKKLEVDNESKKDMIRRFTLAQQHHDPFPTPQGSDDTVQPVNFEAMHKNNVIQTAINDYTFPENQ